jgi:Lrp/AsnC family transcriptional regulator for asnA, asnC and gidA
MVMGSHTAGSVLVEQERFGDRIHGLGGRSDRFGCATSVNALESSVSREFWGGASVHDGNSVVAPGPDLDGTDKAIIGELQLDGRLAYAKLAPLVGLSQAATRHRVNKLVEHGVMQIVAVTDPTMLGFRHQSMLGIRVDEDVRDVADALRRIDAIYYLVVTAGRYDIMAEVFSSDESSFLGVVNDQIRPVPGIGNIEVLTYLDLVKQTYNWGTA